MQSIVLLFWTIFSSLIFCSIALEYSNRWVVQIDGGNGEADRLARKHGFINFGKVIDDYYSFIHQKVEKVSKVPSPHLQKGLMSEPNVKMVDQETMKYYKLLSTHSMHFYNPTDPRYHDMWYINRDDGQPTYNVIDVWKRNITGAGVVVAVVDVGIDKDHPEIQANYDPRASFDVNGNDTDPSPSDSPYKGHGDACAGVIAAVLNNSYCGVGLAYNASLGGIRLIFDLEATDGLECRALIHKNDYIDIYSNSWGPDDTGYNVAGPGPLTQRALKLGTQKGRGGLGSIYVFAAGNGGLGHSCAFDGYTNSIYTISISGITSHGSIPAFGEKCAGIMAVTYSRDYVDNSTVITAGTNKTCRDNFGGSSAATAMASGLIALMLSANPRLSWRDVQHIIARTSRRNPVHIRNYLWTINKANLSVNDYVGFGLMDANKMVYAALNWTTVPPKVNCSIPHPRHNRPFPPKGTLEETIDLSVSKWSKSCDERINYLEHVEVSVNLNYSRRGDLLIKLISPQGTVSNLTHFRPSDRRGFTDLNWVLMTLHHWGENATGSWKLTLENIQVNHNNTGILFNWTLILHGTVEDPLAQNRRVLTPPPTDTSPKPTKETPTDTPTKETPTDRPISDWKISTYVLIAVLVLIIIMSAIVCFICFKRRKKGKPVPVPVPLPGRKQGKPVPGNEQEMVNLVREQGKPVPGRKQGKPVPGNEQEMVNLV